MGSKGLVSEVTETGRDQEDWISGSEAARELDWTNVNSVRNAAREGRFRWRRRGNGRLEYYRPDVVEYRDRQRTSQEAA